MQVSFPVRARARKLAGVVGLALMLVAFRAPAAAPAPVPGFLDRTATGATVACVFDLPRTQQGVDGWVDVALDGAFNVEQIGEPVVPESVVAIPLPAGAHVTSCRVAPSQTAAIDLAGPVRYGRAPAPYSTGPGVPAQPDPATYQLDTPVPPHALVRWDVECHDGQAVLNVHVAPVQYIPATGRLLANQRIDVQAAWETPEPAPSAAVVANALATPQSTGAVVLPAGHFDYVVITSAALLQTPAPYNFQALCAARSREGFAATNVTVEWIYANYSGVRPDGGTDFPTRVRNFIIDAHTNWGTRYVLLGGTAYSPIIVPARQFYGCVATTPPTTEPIGSDMYYACLDGTFDANTNGVYGEANDGVGGQDVDLVAEVYVGRFPVANTNEVARMVRKTLAYEAATPDQLRPVCHVGEYLGFGGISDYATGDMEQLRCGGLYDYYSTVGFANSSYASCFDLTDNLYDAPGATTNDPAYAWPNSEIVRRFNKGGHVFNHLGHGNYYFDFKLNLYSSSDAAALAALTNTSYFLAYSQACDAGRFDDVGDCFAETVVTSANGPAAVIMNTREGWGMANSTDSASQRYHRHFWDLLLSGRSYLLGEANQSAKEALRYQIDGDSGTMRWCYYELTLFGDPALPFAARISQLPPTILHTPLVNQAASGTPFHVACQLGPPGLYDPDTAQLVWRSSLTPGQVSTAALTQVVGTLYDGVIPAAPLGATLSYNLQLATRAGLTTNVPGAGNAYAFHVAPLFSLSVDGDPQQSGAVSPPYGLSQVVSGNTVQATASLREELPGGYAHRCTGWRGGGSVPATGSSNQVTFALAQDSTLVWCWTNEYALSQSSTPAGILASNLWFTQDATAATVTAAARATLGATNYAFAGWYLDGLRQPAGGRAVNTVAGIAMTQPHNAVALYLPLTLDADADQLPDWWEMFYFGTLAYGPTDDPDGDGWGNRDEYLGQTAPDDPASHPAPPVIAVTPLAPVQTNPPPYAIAAVITDSSPLTRTQLVWRLNSGPWKTNALTQMPAVTNGYQATISAGGAPGDTFSYQIQATDSDLLPAQSPIYTAFLQYPLLALIAPLSRTYTSAPPATVTDMLAVSNAGNAGLSWHAYPGFGEYADAPPPDWNLASYGQFPWVCTTNRSFSGPASLHATIQSPVVETFLSQHACMNAPPLRLGTNAVLVFDHWIASEIDTRTPGRCWDGAIVEISTNGGQTFTQLPGPYTYLLSGWDASPWPDGTPCFGGDGSAGWTEVTFDLSAFAGLTVVLRFHYGADDNTDREGWYVDNIRVAPLLPEQMPGTAFAPSADVVAPQCCEPLVMAVDTTRFARRWLRVPVLVRSNDPTAPSAWYDLSFQMLHPPLLTLTAAQATNGSGLVEVDGALLDPDGESRTLTFAYSCDSGATWGAPRFSQVSFTHGTATLHVAQATIDHSPRPGEPAYATNPFTLFWNTRDPSNNVQLAMGTLLRATATDPVFASVTALATPFPVDNQPPTTPVLQVFTHQPRQWSSARQLTFAWNTSDNGGTGVQNHHVSLSRPASEGGGGTNLDFTSAPPLLTLNLDPDSSNWWLSVTARDAMGNASSASNGPFWIDATPPNVSTAALQTTWGRYGRYVVGTTVPLVCSKATDALSGIASYTFANTSRPDAPPRVATSNCLTWSTLLLNATNTLTVAATDRAGNRSALLSLDVLVLDPQADWDGDGISNGEEDLVGSSPLVASPRFAIVRASPQALGLALQWPATAGSLYTVEWAPTPAGNAWSALPGFTGVPGSNGVMSALVPTPASARFYRVRVSR